MKKKLKNLVFLKIVGIKRELVIGFESEFRADQFIWTTKFYSEALNLFSDYYRNKIDHWEHLEGLNKQRKYEGILEISRKIGLKTRERTIIKNVKKLKIGKELPFKEEVFFLL